MHCIKPSSMLRARLTATIACLLLLAACQSLAPASPPPATIAVGVIEGSPTPAPTTTAPPSPTPNPTRTPLPASATPLDRRLAALSDVRGLSFTSTAFWVNENGTVNRDTPAYTISADLRDNGIALTFGGGEDLMRIGRPGGALRLVDTVMYLQGPMPRIGIEGNGWHIAKADNPQWFDVIGRLVGIVFRLPTDRALATRFVLSAAESLDGLACDAYTADSTTLAPIAGEPLHPSDLLTRNPPQKAVLIVCEDGLPHRLTVDFGDPAADGTRTRVETRLTSFNNTDPIVSPKGAKPLSASIDAISIANGPCIGTSNIDTTPLPTVGTISDKMEQPTEPTLARYTSDASLDAITRFYDRALNKRGYVLLYKESARDQDVYLIFVNRDTCHSITIRAAILSEGRNLIEISGEAR